MSRATTRRSHRAIERIYSRVPEVGCKGLCQQACGPIAMTRLEADRIEAFLGHPIGEVDDELACPLLTENGRCSVYALRPLICRIYGAVESLSCEFGCGPSQMLTEEESRGLFTRMRDLSEGEGVTTAPLSLLNALQVARGIGL